MPAAGDATLNLIDVVESRGGHIRKVHLLAICDSGDGSFAVAIPNKVMNQLAGYYLYNITTFPGVTAPADNSDLGIADSNSRDIVDAAGNGQDMIDATSTLWLIPDGVTPGSTNHYPVAWPDAPWTITISNNNVNSAQVHLLFEMAE